MFNHIKLSFVPFWNKNNNKRFKITGIQKLLNKSLFSPLINIIKALDLKWDVIQSYKIFIAVTKTFTILFSLMRYLKDFLPLIQRKIEREKR